MSEMTRLLEEKMAKTITVLKSELNTVRAGRANAALLDRIMVEYYGTPTPLKNLANVSVPDARTLLITPFDPKSVSDVERAINTANIGINPSNDGKSIRLAIPQVTEDRRKELTKEIRKIGEDAKIAARNSRRDANEHVKKIEKSGELTEDDVKTELDSLQKLTDRCMKEIDAVVANKEKELMEL